MSINGVSLFQGAHFLFLKKKISLSVIPHVRAVCGREVSLPPPPPNGVNHSLLCLPSLLLGLFLPPFPRSLFFFFSSSVCVSVCRKRRKEKKERKNSLKNKKEQGRAERKGKVSRLLGTSWQCLGCSGPPHFPKSHFKERKTGKRKRYERSAVANGCTQYRMGLKLNGRYISLVLAVQLGKWTHTFLWKQGIGGVGF